MRKALILLCGLLVVLAALALLRAESRPTILGFIGPLEGKYADLGVHGRNSAQLAVEEAQARPDAKKIRPKLLVADGFGGSDTAGKAAADLIDRGAKVLIGPMLSGSAQAVLDAATARNVPVVSPTVTTPLLSGKRDLFFRVLSESPRWARGLALCARRTLLAQTTVLVVDFDNESYAKPYALAFADAFSWLGGSVIREIAVHGGKIASWDETADQVLAANADAVLLVLSAPDAAEMAKAFAARGKSPQVLSAMWAATRELVLSGGREVEGWWFGAGYAEDRMDSSPGAFKDRYAKRFGYEPNFAAGAAYDAAVLALDALDATGGDVTALPAALVGRKVQGVFGEFTLDEYGDVSRGAFILRLINGELVTHDLIQD